MKKLLLLIAVCAFCTSYSQTIYFEDFESNNGDWTGTGSWEHGISAGNAILSQENCGGSVWQTSLTENYPNNANDTLTSGIFDFSLLTSDPSIYFDLSYITETNYDEVWLEFSLDGGAAWTKLIDDGSAVGWYNDLTNQWWEGGDAAWNTVSNTIPESAGVSSVQVRFIFSSDGSSNRDGIAIDNILITSDYSDIMLLGVNNIISGISNYSDSEPLEFELVNVGSSSITNVEICYNINGGADICETITDEILPGTFLYSFDSTEDFSTSGDYLINASVSNASDSRPCNNLFTNNITLQIPISSFPFIEDFENSSEWAPEGDWEIGIPSEDNVFRNSLACPENQTVCGTGIEENYSNGAMAMVYSPFFDFSALTTDPTLVFDFYYSGEACCDETWLEMSIDQGETWNKVEANGDAVNWYNDSTNLWWDGSNQTWEYSKTTLSGAAGEFGVQFRFVLSSDGSINNSGWAFDNFSVLESAPSLADAELEDISISLGNPDCGFGLDSIAANISNVGADTLYGFTVCFDSGNNPVCETLSDTIAPGEVFSHSFLAMAALEGLYSTNISCYLETEDYRNCNNLRTQEFDNPITPYEVNVETGNVTCNGLNNGVVALAVSGSNGNYDYSWSTGDSTAIITSLEPGMHSVTITDAFGCSTQNSILISEPETLELDITVTDAVNPGDGELDLLVTGGTPEYSFVWSEGSISEDLDGLNAGLYSVTVTDGMGCMSSLTAEIETITSVTELEKLGISLFPNPSNGTFTVKFEQLTVEDLTINVKNSLGQSVYNMEVSENVSVISLDQAKPGVYFVEIANGDTVFTYQVLIQ